MGEKNIITKKTPLETCLIELKVGDRVIKKSNCRRGKIRSIHIVPNSTNDRQLVAQLCVDYDNGGRVIATCDRFEPLLKVKYDVFYPSSVI